MAQLDVSIIYNQFCVTFTLFYFFVLLISYFLIKFWYNKKCRDVILFYELEIVFKDEYYIKKILNL